jgi:FkbH-like protein
VTRKVWGLRRPPLKVVAVDGDNTLWSGIAGEIGPDAVDLSGPRAALAKKLLELRTAGVLLALVSNNDPETVHQVLARKDSLLQAEHFAVISAAWEDKSSRISACAKTLSLGLDSFVFLDDNPVEIAGVRARLPEVMAVTVPPAEELQSFLDNLWALDASATTDEDRMRADFYRHEASRQAFRSEVDDFNSFIESLRLQIDFAPVDAASLERSAQLTRRTNQFNLRPAALDAGALRKLSEAPGSEVWTISVRDRFGDYGQVGLLVLEQRAGALEVMRFMLSCRVLGRGVEAKILGWLADRAEQLGCASVRLIAEHTPRNIPARRLLAALGGGGVDHQRLEVNASPSALHAFRFGEESEPESGANERVAQGEVQSVQRI